MTFGIENLVGNKKAFINFDQYSITKRIPELLDPERITVEILETVEPEKKFIEELKRLIDLGYTIALDDYCMDYDFKKIIDHSKIIKVDFLQNTKEEIEKSVEKFKKQNKVLLAEKVETKEEYEWAKGLGFDLFQGFYFAKPSIRTQKSLDNNALQYMRLMTELGTDEPDFKKLSDILKLDVALTYRLLKLVNAIVNPIEKIRSIQHGIAVLGVEHFKKWLTLSVVQNMAKRETSEVVKYALFRTRFLSSMALHSDMIKYEEELELLGMLSVLDTLLDQKMTEVVDSLPLDPTLADTLLKKETVYTVPYNICLKYEKGEFDAIEPLAESIHYDISQMQKDYISAVKWSEDIFKQLNLFK